MTLSIILLFLFFPYLSALAEEVTCPPTLRVEEKAAEKISGWQANGTVFNGNQVPKHQPNGISSREHMLQYIAIGDMKDAVSLRENEEIVKGNIAKDSWKLSDPNIRYTIVCNYYTTDITLSQPAPQDVKVCDSYSEVRKFMPYKFLRMTCYKDVDY